jgi:tetratricopeptide (TPR) repeat protein
MRTINLRLLAYTFGALVLLIGGTALVHFLQSERIARALLRQADRAEQAEHPQETARFLSRYLEFAPEDTEQRARLGRLLAENFQNLSLGQRQRALFVLEQVLTRDPERHSERILIVRLMLDTDRYEMVEGHLKILLEAMPENAEVERLWGRWQEGRGQFAEAADWYQQSISHDPHHVETYVRLASLLRRRLNSAEHPNSGKEADQLMMDLVAQNEGDFHAQVARWKYLKEWGNLDQSKRLEEASVNVTQALQLAPSEAEVQLAAAELERARHNLDGARNHLATGLKSHPKDSRLYQALAFLELEAGRRDQAIAKLNDGIRAVTGLDRFHLLWDLTNVLIDGNDTGPAAKTIDQVRDSQPTPGAVEFLQARLNMALGQWTEAAQIFEQVRPLLEISPELIEQVDLNLGHCYERLNEPAAQLAAFGRVLSRDPASVSARLGMAKAQTALGLGDDALEQYRQLMKLPGAPISGWIEIARLSIGRNLKTGKSDWVEIEKSLSLVEKAKPEAVEIPLLRAESLVAQGQPDRAREVLLHARDRRPKQVEFWTALAALADRQGKPEDVVQILNEAEKQAGDQVEIRLAWAQWSTDHPDDKSSPPLSKLCDHLEKFAPEDQVRLLRGLASAYYQRGDMSQARQLWTRLAQQPACSHDLELRLVLFELALQAKDRTEMEQIQKGIRQIEGNGGPFGRLCEATRLIQLAKEPAKSENESSDATQAAPINLSLLTQAQSQLELAAAKRPTWPALSLARADIEEVEGHPEKAINHYRRAVELGERNPRVLHRLVNLLLEQHRVEEADQEIRKLQQQGPLRDDLQRLAVAVSLQSQDSARAARLAVNAVNQGSTDYKDYLWLGQVLATAGRSADDAEKQFRRAVELAPKVPDTWLALVKYLAGAKKLGEAEKIIEQARRQLPSEGASLTMAACYEDIGRIEKAKEEYQLALKARPDDPTVLKALTSYYLRIGQTAEAEPILRQLIKGTTSGDDANWARRQLALILAHQSEYREALTLLGLSFDKQGNIKELTPASSPDDIRMRIRILALLDSRSSREFAISRLDDLSRKQALSAEDQFLLARLYEANGSVEKSRNTIRGLASSFDSNPAYLAYYARSLLNHNDLNDAERFIDQLEPQEKAQKAPPGAFGSTELRVQLLELRGENKKALALLETQARSPGAGPSVIITLISSLARQKRWTDALELADRAWDSCPPEAIGGLSVALLRSSSPSDDIFTRLERRIRAALQANPKSANLVLQLADLLEIRSQFDEAESLYRQLVSDQSHNIMAFNNLSWLLAMKPGKGDEALRMVNRAIDLAGPLPHLLDTRALVYLALDQSGPAIADLQQALGESPTSPNAFRYFHLARALRLAGNAEDAAQAFRKAAEAGLELGQLHPGERLAYREMVKDYN